MTVRAVSAGEYVAADGQIATHGYTVLSGLLVWSEGNEQGDEVTVGALLSGSWFGHATLFAQNPRRGHIAALRDSALACMPKDVFDWLLANSIPFNNFMLRHMCARVQWLMGNIAARSTMTVDQQVAAAILGMLDPELNPGAGPEINVSQEELGRVAGYSRQRCCAAVKSLRSLGIVETSYCDLVVPDRERLRAFVFGPGTSARRAALRKA
jgi:CRP-like cAMP-binding protein